MNVPSEKATVRVRGYPVGEQSHLFVRNYFE